jgi:hypothetical protein
MFEKDPSALIYSTPPIDPRIAAQRGLFVLHSTPLSPKESPASELGPVEPPSTRWETKHLGYLRSLCGTEDLATKRGRPQAKFPDMIGILVPSAVKAMLLSMLETNFGFSRSTIYPDFAGIAGVYTAKQS